MELLIYWKWLTADSSYGSLPGQCIHIPSSLVWASQSSPMRNSSHRVSPVNPGTELYPWCALSFSNDTNTAAVRERMELAWADLQICVKFQTQNRCPGLICLHEQGTRTCENNGSSMKYYLHCQSAFPARPIRPSLSMRAHLFCLLYSI